MGGEEEENEINLTPMLDVVFIMLIFFIVTASFIKEAGIDVNRPDAPTSESVADANILIAISSNDEIWIDTPGERKFCSDDQMADSATRLPWGRLGRPEEIGRGVVFLCDPASDYITGSTLRIDGGINLPWWASRGSGAP
jgi:hypothetical protein